jgi:tRNA(Ile)-lysidine synthase TilS/MesJ
MDRSKITLIRPLIDTPEKEIKKFVKRNNVEVISKDWRLSKRMKYFLRGFLD